MATEERNHVGNGGQELAEEEQEDQKMEQFFALIRNFNEARNRRKNEIRKRVDDDDQEIISKKKQNKTRKLDNEQSSWVPRFEWADFTEEIEFRRPPISFPNPIFNKKDDKKKLEDVDGGLDLKLAL